MNNQEDNQIPYTQHHEQSQLVNTLEWMAVFLLIGWAVRRMRERHHVKAGIAFLASAVGALLVMVNLDMTSDAAYFFWSLVLVAVVSLGKAIS